MRQHVTALLAATTLVIGGISTALAADMPARTSIYTKAPSDSYSWTGFYVGANVGGGWAIATPISPRMISIPLCSLEARFPVRGI